MVAMLLFIKPYVINYQTLQCPKNLEKKHDKKTYPSPTARYILGAFLIIRF